MPAFAAGAGTSAVARALRSLDANPKVHSDYVGKSVSGGIITIAAAVVMLLLFGAEYLTYLAVHKQTELVVDSQIDEKLTIHFNLTMRSMACAVVEVVALDISGEKQLDIHDSSVHKTRLHADGSPIDHDESTPHLDRIEERVNEDAHAHVADHHEKHGPADKGSEQTEATTKAPYCGSCYGAGALPTSCCNTCEEVRSAYREKGWALGDPARVEQCARENSYSDIAAQSGEGCRLEGHVAVNKVAGNFHLAPGRSFMSGSRLIHDLTPFRDLTFNTSHYVTHLAFGDAFPGQEFPADGEDTGELGMNTMFQYFLKVVPTTYKPLSRTMHRVQNYDADGSALQTNQFSLSTATRFVDVKHGASGLPGVFFFYDFTPIRITFTESRRVSFLAFLTSTCAIVGGVFTLSGVAEGLAFRATRFLAAASSDDARAR